MTSTAPADSGIQQPQPQSDSEPAEDDAEETDADAIKVKCLVDSFDDVNHTMAYVEVSWRFR